MMPTRDIKKIIFATILIITFMPLARLCADEQDVHFVRGNEFYQNEDYTTAISHYQKIIELGYESWEVYYNLGNAYYKNGQISLAILNYERAKKLNPKNEDINFNLELANLSIVDKIPRIPQVFFMEWISRLTGMLSINTLGAITIAIYLFATGLGIFRILTKGLLSKTNLTLIFIVGFFFVTSAALFLKKVYEIENRVEAIVLVPKVDVKSAPNEKSTEMFTLHEGVKVQMQELSSNWAKIRLLDGKVGWVQAEMIEKI
ncbi:MAG: tetratricopeptide repeat protein [bacterium]